jgi:uridine kinase
MQSMKSSIKNKYTTKEIAEKVLEHCANNDIRFVFISGNGASGKSHFTEVLAKEVQKKGHVNALSTDDFVVDTALRNNATSNWTDKDGNEYEGRYTTSFKESYFIQNINAIICNLHKGHDYYHWPKRAINSSECVLLKSDALITVIEGVGSVFTNKEEIKHIDIFIECDEGLEKSRRNNRGEKSNEKSKADIDRYFKTRRSQYETIIEPFRGQSELVLKSMNDFSLEVIIDKFNLTKQ